ncbi:MAG: D-alanyl-D-alanine carboxypeptidase/D-alanyl-D-alanine-endopeptidase [Verrucomicrobiota bacterium]|nr:D-alanyl-D-alanine carboxypeptidase/D-alanyl-D-alanine-endopeptidase [Verrucomicrobiota bacterium]
MKFSKLFLFALFLTTFQIAQSAPSVAQTNIAEKKIETLAEFQTRLQKIVAQPRFAAAALGIKVESLDTGKIIFEHNADKLLKPASNAKMYTGALALDRLGPNYKIKTSFYATAKPDSSGTIEGDLIVYGRGDPSLSARFHHENYEAALQQLADALISAGVKKINGNLIGDESFFKGAPFGEGWSWDDLQFYYGAEASALSLQDNVVDLVFKPGEKIGAACKIIMKPETTFLVFSNRTQTLARGGKSAIEIYRPVGENIIYVSGNVALNNSVSDAVSVHNPALWFVTMLKETLAKRGVALTGEVHAKNWLDREVAPLDFGKMVEVAFVESKPMSELVKGMMKPSQNLYAHLLLLQVGEKTRAVNSKTQTSAEAGLLEMKKFLSEAGIKKGDVLLEEGSGLSRGALLKPSASVSLLKYMRKHRDAEIFYNALPIAGVDGTLKNRFKGTAAEKNIHAKTGTIRYVNSISGYVTSAAKEHLVFSIMFNNYNGADGREQSDAIAAMLADLAVRTEGKMD